MHLDQGRAIWSHSKQNKSQQYPAERIIISYKYGHNLLLFMLLQGIFQGYRLTLKLPQNDQEMCWN